MTTAECPQKQTDRWWQFLLAIFVNIVRWTKHIYKHEPEFDGSN